MDVLIRDLPPELHAELTRRAAAADKSVRAYLLEVLTDHLSAPSTEQWLEQLNDLPPIAATGVTGAGLVAAGRNEDDEPTGR